MGVLTGQGSEDNVEHFDLVNVGLGNESASVGCVGLQVVELGPAGVSRKCEFAFGLFADGAHRDTGWVRAVMELVGLQTSTEHRPPLQNGAARANIIHLQTLGTDQL